MSYFDCVVIGAGVAGMTSAIYLKRYNVNVLLLEKNAPGGQIIQTPNIENYPGFTNIDGATLALNMFDQVTKLGVPYQYGDVVRIEDLGKEKIIYTEKEKINTKFVIIATGRKPRKLGLEKEDKLIGRGISWCATCDGMFYKDKCVAVVGGGNSALEEALFLSNMCKKVDILYRGGSLRADKVVQQKVFEKENIEVHYYSEVKKLVEKENKLVGIKLLEEGTEKNLSIDGLFIYIGFEPDTKVYKELGVKTEEDYIIVGDKMETNISNVYACGDVVKKELYQITTAIGEASLAAYQVKKSL